MLTEMIWSLMNRRSVCLLKPCRCSTTKVPYKLNGSAKTTSLALSSSVNSMVIRTSWDASNPRCCASAIDLDHTQGVYQTAKRVMDSIVENRLLNAENHLETQTQYSLQLTASYSYINDDDGDRAYHLSML